MGGWVGGWVGVYVHLCVCECVCVFDCVFPFRQAGPFVGGRHSPGRCSKFEDTHSSKNAH